MDDLLTAVAIRTCDGRIERGESSSAAPVAPPHGETERLLVARESLLADARATRKLLAHRGWMCDWRPEGKPAMFLYAYEVALVGKGSVDGCMARVWGGDAVKLKMHSKVLAIKVRQLFGKRAVKANHALVASLERMCLIHCDGRANAGTGALLLREAGDATTASVRCGSVVCFSNGPGRRHLEAKICQITAYTRYEPGIPGSDSDEVSYVNYWKARMVGNTTACDVSAPIVPRVVRRSSINFAATDTWCSALRLKAASKKNDTPESTS